MEKGIFISIKPIHLRRIESWEKNYEFRNYIPKDEIDKLYVYETTPTCSLKYILTIDKIIEYPDKIKEDGYGNKDFNKGLKKSKYAYHIQKVEVLDKPIPLKELREKYSFTAPQGYAYDTRYPELIDKINDLEKRILIENGEKKMNIIRKTIENDEEYLRQISKPVDLKDKGYKDEIKQLDEFCKETECFALAAVQIGIPKRMVYLKNTSLDVDIDNKEYNESKVLINPEILSCKGHTQYWEACLSCLDYMGLVDRPYELVVKYNDEDGAEHTEKFEGFAATVLSHELDHLDGILHMDIAKQVLEMEKEERKKYREDHPYKIISKTSIYKKPKNKKDRK